MIANIIYAIKQELKYFVKANGGMVVFDTNLEDDIEFSLPLIVLECDEAPESAALFGGIIRMDWCFDIRVYTQEPDAYVDDNTTASTACLDYIDLIKNHFIKGVWLTNLMKNLTNDYQFRITYSGTQTASTLKTKDKLIKGFVHRFDSIGIDNSATSTLIMTNEAQTLDGSIDIV
jgi:tRNA(Leu) C34 or U34 (ribose-2'-O)-methylase TrmL